ncbi:MAG: hypothetical protein ACYTBW_07480 [Planctomycetota bacterium]
MRETIEARIKSSHKMGFGIGSTIKREKRPSSHSRACPIADPKKVVNKTTMTRPDVFALTGISIKIKGRASKTLNDSMP